MTPSAQLFRLDGRVAFVSGAAGYLGRVMTRALLEAGAHVIINGRDQARLSSYSNELKNAGYRPVSCAAFDVGSISAVREFFSSQPRLDVLVNNAIDMTAKSRDSLAPEDFETTYRSSVVATFEAVRAALPALRNAVVQGGDASIVNVASMYAAAAPDKRIYSTAEQASPFHYGPAKAALVQLTRHLAAELGPERIRVNALLPGPLPRPDVLQRDPGFSARLASRTMLGRVGKAEEIAGPLLFLASQASSYMTGASLVIDGGWTAW